LRREHSPALTTARLSLGRAHLLATSAIREARRMGVPTESLSLVGGLRRFAPHIDDPSLLAVAPGAQQAALLTAFAALPIVTKVMTRTPSSVTVATQRGNLTLHVTSPDDAGAALVWCTGAAPHVERLAERARTRGMRFDDARLERSDGTPIPCPTEPDLYRVLDLPFIAPELREGDAELEAAERGELPNLVSDLHIRGDLHMHSTWSDGRDTLEYMVYTSRQLGYEYVAITDHSERSMASRHLAADDIPRQREELAALRSRIQGIEVLHGVEVDIMRDGTLDFNDEQLAGFDIVLASLHDHAGHDAERLTERYLAAMRHPLVNIITHPANRSPAQSEGYDLDFDRLFAAAVATGTAMEVDGAPGHLDLDGALAKRAVAAGVTLAIDSDCHRADALSRQMRFGIGTARRGWVEPQHVLNSRSVDHVRTFVASKRARG
jgi:DNA polymerase (family 10)